MGHDLNDTFATSPRYHASLVGPGDAGGLRFAYPRATGSNLPGGRICPGYVRRGPTNRVRRQMIVR
jgi:hypothetical protein